MLTKKDLTKKEIDKNIEQIMECIEYFKEKEEEFIDQNTGDPIVDAFLKYRIRKKIGLFGEAHALFFGVLNLDLEDWEKENRCREALAIMWEAMEYGEQYDKDVLSIREEFSIFKAGYKIHSENI